MLKENRIYVRIKQCDVHPELIGREGFYYKHKINIVNGEQLTMWFSKEGIHPYCVCLSLDCFESIKSYS